MKRITVSIIPFALLILSSLPGQATEIKAMSGMAIAAGKAATAQVHKGRGTVNRVDVNAGKVNITHGPIRSLNWPGMSMDFTVKDKQGLAKLKPAQKVEFKLAEQSRGQYVVT